VQNPAKEIKLLSEKSHEQKRYLLPKELDEIIQASRHTRGKFYLPTAIYLGAEHGASKQVILSLEWKQSQDTKFFGYTPLKLP
jgi:hypothetical protein